MRLNIYLMTKFFKKWIKHISLMLEEVKLLTKLPYLKLLIKNIIAAALDVFESESLNNNSMLLKNQNIYITPHIAGLDSITGRGN